jgi:hypothetical protein
LFAGESSKARREALQQNLFKHIRCMLVCFCSGNGKTHPGGLGAIQDVTEGAPLPEKLRDA